MASCNMLVSRAIRKYGRDAFTVEFLVEGLTLENANNLEKLFIDLNDSLAPNGYNVAEGGSNGNPIAGYTNDQKDGRNRKISETMSNKQRTPEHCKNISESKKGRKRPDVTERNKFNNPVKKPGVKQKISNTLTGRYTGDNNPNSTRNRGKRRGQLLLF